jgi:signal transduction histidine kinase
MAAATDALRAKKETTLQRTLTDTLNEVSAESALVGIYRQAGGPLVSYGAKGFSEREAHAVLRALSGIDPAAVQGRFETDEGNGAKALRMRLITPSARSLFAVPLRYQQQTYGILVVGRKESAALTKKEKTLLETTGEAVSRALEQARLFDGTAILARPLVTHEPPPAKAAPAAMPSLATSERQERFAALLHETTQALPFDRAWVTCFDALAGAVEVVGAAGEQNPEHKKELKPGQRLALDASASGWAVRHRKPRVDNDLASTQGRFLDHKHLYRDRYKSALVVPFFVRGQIGGTITLASRTPAQYSLSDVGVLEPLMGKIVELLQEPAEPPPAAEAAGSAVERTAPAPPPAPEPLIRKQERQAAIGEFSAFLATEIREPLASIRAQLEEVTGEGTLDFDPQTRVENAMRDLIRVEAILSEILDFAKPLELHRRALRIPDVLESALTVVGTELEVNRIRVTKDYAANLAQVRCDDAKMQQVFLSIFKNSLEAMSPGGQLHIEVSQHRAGRSHEVQILIKNDGVPIPTEHVGKVFEPFFTTKRAGTGLGLASVKKIVEEHQGQISIASGPGQGTTVLIKLPAVHRGGPYRRGGRGPRRPRRRSG